MFPHRLYSRLFVVATTVSIGCSSAPKAESKIPAMLNSADEEILVDDGNCSEPVYSPSGDRLLYICQNRPTHSQSQIYERDLSTGTERRLTFQNGSTFHPRYHPKDPWIIYSSTTDELKENPPLLNPPTEPSPLPADLQQPTEIYIHSLDGFEITRITDRLGHDGEAQFSTDGKELTWTRVDNKRTKIFSINRFTKVAHALSGFQDNPVGYVQAPGRKASAWLEWDKDFTHVRLKFKKGSTAPVEINADHNVDKDDLAFSPDGQFLAWSQFNALRGYREIWVLNVATSCSFMLVGSDSADRRHPAFSPDVKRIAYTITRGERSRIAAMPFVPPTGSCLPAE